MCRANSLELNRKTTSCQINTQKFYGSVYFCKRWSVYVKWCDGALRRQPKLEIQFGCFGSIGAKALSEQFGSEILANALDIDNATAISTIAQSIDSLFFVVDCNLYSRQLVPVNDGQNNEWK